MRKKDISIYIHWPFCTSKCPYCDFNSHIKRVIDNNEWGLALTTELHYLFEKYFKEKENHALKSIFFLKIQPIKNCELTYGEIDPSFKNKNSHRNIAFDRFLKSLLKK